MTAQPPPRPRILLLEDSDIDAELIRLHLGRGGMDVDWVHASGRREFERALDDASIDLVLADYSLPDFDGFDALTLARSRLPDVPVVFVSGVVGEEIAIDALRRGATDYVLKRSMPRLAASVGRALAEARERIERRRADSARRRSEADMRLALDAAQLGLFRYAARTDTLVWDGRCQQLFGVVGRELGYADFLRRVDARDRDGLDAALQATLSDPAAGTLTQQFRCVLDDGSTRWIVMRGQRFGGSAGVLTGVLQDVTATRELEARQRHAEMLFRVATQATGVGVWELGPARDALWFDDGYRTVCGIPATASPSLAEVLRDVVHADDRAEVERALGAAYDTDGAVHIDLEYRIVCAAGDEPLRWVAMNGRRVQSPDAPPRIVGTVRDVTEQRRLEAALRRANSALEERVAERTRELMAEIGERSRVEDTLRQMQRLEAVGQLTSGVAHDFNNLLAVVLSNVSLVTKLLQQRPPVDDRVTKRLASMRDAANRGATLVRQLLAFSRRQRLEPQTVALNEIVSGMRDLLQASIGGSVHLQTELADDLWPALVDPTQLELIILNLAINARDAMEVGGSLTVRTSNVTLAAPPARPEEPEPGDYVELSVVDTGTGMDDAVLAKAFEPFFTTKEIGKGSGLGLAQVYGFAKQSGGGVRIRTRPGDGTAVHVYMPRAQQRDAAGTDAPDTTPGAVGAAADGAGRTLLIVDDDHAVREVTASLLRLHGFRVCEAADADTALAAAADGTPIDLTIADFAMPRMNGADFARELRRRRPELPVLFMTGFAELGALDDVPEEFVVQKPVAERVLVERVLRLLDRR